jgi:hypothetical protein
MTVGINIPMRRPFGNRISKILNGLNSGFVVQSRDRCGGWLFPAPVPYGTFKQRLPEQEDATVLRVFNESGGSPVCRDITLAPLNRTARQCRERYNQYLKYSPLCMEPCTLDRDERLVGQLREHN